MDTTTYDSEMDTSYCLVDMEEPDDRILLVLAVFKANLRPFYLRYVSLRSQVACARFSRQIADMVAILGATSHACSQGNATIRRAWGWISRCRPDLVSLEEPRFTEPVFRPTTSSITTDGGIAPRAGNATWSSLASGSASSLCSNNSNNSNNSKNSSVSELSFCSTAYNTSVIDDDNESEAATESLADSDSDPGGTDEQMSMGVILEPSSAIA